MITPLKSRLKQNALVIFFILAFAISWTIWIPSVIAFQNTTGGKIPAWMLILIGVGTFGPTAAALILNAVIDGKNGITNLLKKLVLWRVKWHWYLVALLTPIILLLLSFIIFRLLGGYPGKFNANGLVLRALSAFPLALAFGPLGEELGWRGFALPRLQRENSAMISSIILGALWTFWHIPLFFVPGAALPIGVAPDGINIGIYLISTIGSAILFTWLYNSTGGSVLLAALFHLLFNISGDIFFGSFPSITPAIALQINQFDIVLKWVLVITVLQIFGEKYLSRAKRSEEVLPKTD